MNNSQVAHIWAQNTGKSAKGSNFSCDDNRLYSYYTCIAFIEKGVAFISSSTMSPSTSKHLGHARRAINGDFFYSPAFRYGHHYPPTVKKCIAATIKGLREDRTKLGKALTRLPHMIQNIERRKESIRNIARKLKIKTGKFPTIPPALRKKADETAKKTAQRVKEAELKRQEQAAAARIRDKADFEAWLTTGKGSAPHSYRRYYCKNDYLTLDGDTVKTSQGAEAPLYHVKKALAFYYSRRNEDGTFTPYQTNGHKISLGHFTLDSIDDLGNVKAGCHTFTAGEINRFANQWNLKGE